MKNFLLAVSLALCGCANLHSVVVSTQTVLGVSVSENPTTQLYEARLGYARNEFAFVPGNINAPGAVPDVLMEMRASDIFTGGGFYQRLAVGSNAVVQPGASMMFAKDANGTLNPVAAISMLTNSAAKKP
jgi:hypothetical protein